ncbi:NAD(P)-binding protein [Cadophora sp. DSE1049]|nr:NAD(P)-binding protein [Cadophora sp. DSE1049]
MALKNVIVAGASGTIGTPIVAALLAAGQFNVSALSRPDSKSTFPEGVTVKRADLSSRTSLTEALHGQDVVICTLNDEAAQLQGELVEAAYEAGVERYMPNEWAGHDMNVEGTPMEEVYEGKRAILRLLDEKVRLAEKDGRGFAWTGLNTGVFFDWALQTSFLDISLPPAHSAKIWDSGTAQFSATTLSTVGRAVVSILTTASGQTRNKLIEIESFSVSQNEIVAALEKVTGQKWKLEKTSMEEQLGTAGANLEQGKFLEAFYVWVRAWVFSGNEGAKLMKAEEGNKLLGVGGESIEEVVGRVVRGEKV